MTESLRDLSFLFHAGEDLCLKAQALFGNEHRQKEWFMARALLRELGGENCVIEYSESGKPVLSGGSAHVGISHSAAFFALGLNAASPIGLDIEQKSGRALRVAEKFLSVEEMRTLPMAEAEDAEGMQCREDAATAMWSAKEAVFKLSGSDFTTLPEVALSPSAEGYVSVSGGRAVRVLRQDFDRFVLTLATFR